VGRGRPSPSTLVGGSLETSTAVQLHFPSVQIPSSSRGSNTTIVGLVDRGNVSKISLVGMAHP
jgi:hypothetical protein